MGLLDGIEKLINEHGSAAILRERIALANDKYSALESENVVLCSENEALKLDNAKLQEQRRTLENKLNTFVLKTHDKILSKEQINILLLLKKEGVDENEVIKMLGRGTEATRFDLVELAEAGLIERTNLSLLWFCGLTQDGRRHLKENGLLM